MEFLAGMAAGIVAIIGLAIIAFIVYVLRGEGWL